MNSDALEHTRDDGGSSSNGRSASRGGASGHSHLGRYDSYDPSLPTRELSSDSACGGDDGTETWFNPSATFLGTRSGISRRTTPTATVRHARLHNNTSGDGGRCNVEDGAELNGGDSGGSSSSSRDLYNSVSSIRSQAVLHADDASPTLATNSILSSSVSASTRRHGSSSSNAVRSTSRRARRVAGSRGRKSEKNIAAVHAATISAVEEVNFRGEVDEDEDVTTETSWDRHQDSTSMPSHELLGAGGGTRSKNEDSGVQRHRRGASAPLARGRRTTSTRQRSGRSLSTTSSTRVVDKFKDLGRGDTAEAVAGTAFRTQWRRPVLAWQISGDAYVMASTAGGRLFVAGDGSSSQHHLRGTSEENSARASRAGGNAHRHPSASWPHAASSSSSSIAKGGISVWDGRTGTYEYTLTGHRDMVLALTVLPHLDALLSASADGSGRIWDLRTLQCVLLLPGHGAAVTAIAASTNATTSSTAYGLPGGAYASGYAAAGWHGGVGTGPGISRFDALSSSGGGAGGSLLQLAGMFFFTGTADGVVRQWSSTAACGHSNVSTIIASMQKGHSSLFSGAKAASAAAASTGNVVWGSHTNLTMAPVYSNGIQHGTCMRVLRGHTGAITAIVSLAAAARVASVSRDGTLRVWGMLGGARGGSNNGGGNHRGFGLDNGGGGGIDPLSAAGGKCLSTVVAHGGGAVWDVAVVHVGEASKYAAATTASPALRTTVVEWLVTVGASRRNGVRSGGHDFNGGQNGEDHNVNDAAEYGAVGNDSLSFPSTHHASRVASSSPSSLHNTAAAAVAPSIRVWANYYQSSTTVLLFEIALPGSRPQVSSLSRSQVKKKTAKRSRNAGKGHKTQEQQQLLPYCNEDSEEEGRGGGGGGHCACYHAYKEWVLLAQGHLLFAGGGGSEDGQLGVWDLLYHYEEHQKRNQGNYRLHDSQQQQQQLTQHQGSSVNSDSSGSVGDGHISGATVTTRAAAAAGGERGVLDSDMDTCVGRFFHHSHAITALTLAGTRLYSLSTKDGTVCRWDLLHLAIPVLHSNSGNSGRGDLALTAAAARGIPYGSYRRITQSFYGGSGGALHLNGHTPLLHVDMTSNLGPNAVYAPLLPRAHAWAQLLPPTASRNKKLGMGNGHEEEFEDSDVVVDGNVLPTNWEESRRAGNKAQSRLQEPLLPLTFVNAFMKLHYSPASTAEKDDSDGGDSISDKEYNTGRGGGWDGRDDCDRAALRNRSGNSSSHVGVRSRVRSGGAEKGEESEEVRCCNARALLISLRLFVLVFSLVFGVVVLTVMWHRTASSYFSEVAACNGPCPLFNNNNNISRGDDISNGGGSSSDDGTNMLGEAAVTTIRAPTGAVGNSVGVVYSRGFSMTAGIEAQLASTTLPGFREPHTLLSVYNTESFFVWLRHSLTVLWKDRNQYRSGVRNTTTSTSKSSTATTSDVSGGDFSVLNDDILAAAVAGEGEGEEKKKKNEHHEEAQRDLTKTRVVNYPVIAGENVLMGSFHVRVRRAAEHKCAWPFSHTQKQRMGKENRKGAEAGSAKAAPGSSSGDSSSSNGGGGGASLANEGRRRDALDKCWALGKEAGRPGAEETTPFSCSLISPKRMSFMYRVCPTLLAGRSGVEDAVSDTTDTDTTDTAAAAMKHYILYEPSAGIPYEGQLRSYAYGGYSIDLSFAETYGAALRAIDTLEEIGLIDDVATRLVDISFFLFNPSTTTIVRVLVSCEIPADGSWITRLMLRPFHVFGAATSVPVLREAWDQRSKWEGVAAAETQKPKAVLMTMTRNPNVLGYVAWHVTIIVVMSIVVLIVLCDLIARVWRVYRDKVRSRVLSQRKDEEDKKQTSSSLSLLCQRCRDVMSALAQVFVQEAIVTITSITRLLDLSIVAFSFTYSIFFFQWARISMYQVNLDHYLDLVAFPLSIEPLAEFNIPSGVVGGLTTPSALTANISEYGDWRAMKNGPFLSPSASAADIRRTLHLVETTFTTYTNLVAVTTLLVCLRLMIVIFSFAEYVLCVRGRGRRTDSAFVRTRIVALASHSMQLALPFLLALTVVSIAAFFALADAIFLVSGPAASWMNMHCHGSTIPSVWWGLLGFCDAKEEVRVPPRYPSSAARVFHGSGGTSVLASLVMGGCLPLTYWVLARMFLVSVAMAVVICAFIQASRLLAHEKSTFETTSGAETWQLLCALVFTLRKWVTVGVHWFRRKLNVGDDEDEDDDDDQHQPQQHRGYKGKKEGGGDSATLSKEEKKKKKNELEGVNRSENTAGSSSSSSKKKKDEPSRGADKAARVEDAVGTVLFVLLSTAAENPALSGSPPKQQQQLRFPSSSSSKIFPHSSSLTKHTKLRGAPAYAAAPGQDEEPLVSRNDLVSLLLLEGRSLLLLAYQNTCASMNGGEAEAASTLTRATTTKAAAVVFGGGGVTDKDAVAAVHTLWEEIVLAYMQGDHAAPYGTSWRKAGRGGRRAARYSCRGMDLMEVESGMEEATLVALQRALASGLNTSMNVVEEMLARLEAHQAYLAPLTRCMEQQLGGEGGVASHDS